jgi:chemotaxis receptor (MCP) glutamine deamidase CheD
LAVKIFGGGRIISDMSNIGKKNIEFVHGYSKKSPLRKGGFGLTP